MIQSENFKHENRRAKLQFGSIICWIIILRILWKTPGSCNPKIKHFPALAKTFSYNLFVRYFKKHYNYELYCWARLVTSYQNIYICICSLHAMEPTVWTSTEEDSEEMEKAFNWYVLCICHFNSQHFKKCLYCMNLAKRLEAIQCTEKRMEIRLEVEEGWKMVIIKKTDAGENH